MQQVAVHKSSPIRSSLNEFLREFGERIEKGHKLVSHATHTEKGQEVVSSVWEIPEA